jgi:hypothetical protein
LRCFKTHKWRAVEAQVVRLGGALAAAVQVMKYVFSKQTDFFAFVCPVLLSLAYLPTYSAKEYRGGKSALPFWHYLVLVVLVDVAHVWGTMFRTYFDSEALNKRWNLFVYSPPILWALSFATHFHSKSLFWTLIAYLAIYHFVSQNYGLLALYKARCRERGWLDYKLDYYTLLAGALGPVLLWHASPTRRFDWFNAGEEFLFQIPDTWRLPVLVSYLGVGVLWSARQAFKLAAGQEELNEGKLMIMGLSWFTWAVGALIDHQVRCSPSKTCQAATAAATTEQLIEQLIEQLVEQPATRYQPYNCAPSPPTGSLASILEPLPWCAEYGHRVVGVPEPLRG